MKYGICSVTILQNIQLRIPRYENTVADSLAVATGKFKTPSAGQKEYQVDIVNRPSIHDNSKYW